MPPPAGGVTVIPAAIEGFVGFNTDTAGPLPVRLGVPPPLLLHYEWGPESSVFAVPTAEPCAPVIVGATVGLVAGA